mmetsp:Transcript_18750/g.47149  ORF Transcript_18750/g.47149 Transcript_18750/m.47149 type:complete len:113 (-) Transcript_18750:224-562(-)|eukprot:CAMPEP_0174885522 /NCGR_PEP_ID=MMETSP0167-20121228/773_1 /TAXON_ID=38298 /ORGANISM="Rhodella maculata, Strain CCMP736" /LENGTH=112 /DNA_ID=CAMNT_0016121113 /DNA_START=75 /DNA_END=413 /DNA_ORIENTATION=+
MGLVYRAYLSSDKVYVCSCCGSHLANIDDVISKTFQGRHGRAYLFTNVVNVSVGKKEVRMLITGRHTVADISCNVCETVMGWKYIEAFEPTQKYKEGKIILEKSLFARECTF